MLVRALIALLLLLLLLPLPADEAKEGRLAIPGAAGFGARALEGWPTTPTVCQVTNLSDSGAGSLRDCLANDVIVVFRIGGTIELLSNLVVSTSNVLVNFLTAPGEGIQLVRSDSWTDPANKHLVRVSGEDIVLIGLRARGALPAQPGDVLHIDATAKRVFVDRCSLIWGSDEVIEVDQGATFVTIQRCLIAEPIAHELAGNPGYLIQNTGNYISFYRNVMALAFQRFPSSSGGGVTEVRENVMYATSAAIFSENSDCDEVYAEPLELGFWDNLWLVPSSVSRTSPPVRTLPQQDCTINGTGCYGIGAYLDGNDAEWEAGETQADLLFCREQGINGTGCTANNNQPGEDGPCASHSEWLTTSPPFAHYTPPTSTAATLEADLVVGAEAGHPTADSVDTCVRSHITNRTGETLTLVLPGTLEQVTDGCGPYDTISGGTPYTDADGDGMEDACETEYLGGTGASPTADLDGDGYLNIEECMNDTRPDAWVGRFSQ
jgi:pectate lyase